MIPIRLLLENFVSHVRSELDFTKFDVALLVGEQNGNPYISNAVGKSSIFDAMRWCLFNKSRFSSKDRVVKRGKAVCKVIFEFAVGDEKYKVVRKLNKRSNITDVYFYKRIGNKWCADGLTCDTPTMTNKKISEIIKMSDDTFVNSIYFKQNDVSGFATATTAKRKEIMKEVLPIGIWDEYQQTAKDILKKLESQRDILQERKKLLNGVDVKYEQIKKSATDVELSLENINEKLNSLQKEILEKDKTINDLQSIISQKEDFNISTLKKQKQELLQKIKELKNDRAKIKKDIENNLSEITLLESQYQNLETKVVKVARKVSRLGSVEKKIQKIIDKFDIGKVNKFSYSQEDIDKQKQLLTDNQERYRALSQKLVNINSISLGSECPICFSTIDNLNDISKKRKRKQKEIKNKIKELESSIDGIQSEIEKKQKALDKTNEAVIFLERVELALARKEVMLTECRFTNDTLNSKLAELESTLNNHNEKYNYIEDLLKNINVDDDIYGKIENSEKEKKLLIDNKEDLKDRAYELSIEHGVLKGQMLDLERRISELNTVKSQLSPLLEEIEVYKNLVKAFGKDGIQAIIMENVTEDLKRYANSILKQISNEPTSIDFITQKQTGSGSWKEQFDIKIIIGSDELDFYDLSGGEQVRISIALRLALSQLLMRRIGSNVKFLLLDEVDQALDRQGIDALAQAIFALSKDLKILVITHNEAMKEKFQNIITIHKGSAGSVLSQ